MVVFNNAKNGEYLNGTNAKSEPFSTCFLHRNISVQASLQLICVECCALLIKKKDHTGA